MKRRSDGTSASGMPQRGCCSGRSVKDDQLGGGMLPSTGSPIVGSVLQAATVSATHARWRMCAYVSRLCADSFLTLRKNAYALERFTLGPTLYDVEALHRLAGGAFDEVV